MTVLPGVMEFSKTVCIIVTGLVTLRIACTFVDAEASLSPLASRRVVVELAPGPGRWRTSVATSLGLPALPKVHTIYNPATLLRLSPRQSSVVAPSTSCIIPRHFPPRSTRLVHIQSRHYGIRFSLLVSALSPPSVPCYSSPVRVTYYIPNVLLAPAQKSSLLVADSLRIPRSR